jgi:hypothetical protein
MSLSGCQMNPIDVNVHLDSTIVYLIKMESKSEITNFGLKMIVVEPFTFRIFVIDEQFLLDSRFEKLFTALIQLSFT